MNYRNIKDFIIASYEGIENTKAVVIDLPPSINPFAPIYGVFLFDMDVEESVGGYKSYPSLAAAKEAAQLLSKGKLLFGEKSAQSAQLLVKGD